MRMGEHATSISQRARLEQNRLGCTLGKRDAGTPVKAGWSPAKFRQLTENFVAKTSYFH
jgi:hypothetical protein